MLDSDTSPHRNPLRCSRASSTTMASSRRLTVSCRTPRENSERYGSENCRCLVISAGSSGSPLASKRLSTTPLASTDGMSIRVRSRSSRYSCTARCSSTSLTAYTSWPTRTNRTTWREMPRGRATSFSAGHSASGVSQGRVIRRASGCADKNLGTAPSSHRRRTDRTARRAVLVGVTDPRPPDADEPPAGAGGSSVATTGGRHHWSIRCARAPSLRRRDGLPTSARTRARGTRRCRAGPRSHAAEASATRSGR